jgi:hypothetical protein
MYNPYALQQPWPQYGAGALSAVANFGFSQLTGVPLPPLPQAWPSVPWQVPGVFSRRSRLVESLKNIVVSVIEKVADEIRGVGRRAIAPPPPYPASFRHGQPPAVPAPPHEYWYPVNQCQPPPPQIAPTLVVPSEQSTHFPNEDPFGVASLPVPATPLPPLASGSSLSEEEELRELLPNVADDSLIVPPSYGAATVPSTPWPESPVRLPPGANCHRCSVCGEMHTSHA